MVKAYVARTLYAILIQRNVFNVVFNVFDIGTVVKFRRLSGQQIDKRFEQIDKRFEQIDKRFEQIDKRFEQVDKRIDNLSAEMGALHRTLFKLDVDTQKNFHLLFDTNKVQNDKQLLFEKQLYRLTDQLDNTILEDSFINS